MKIGSGIFSGMKLYVPKDKNVRPTLTKIRQAIFNMIRGKIQDSRVVDFFAGTGAFGFEALSNGAKEVIFVEKKYKNIIYKNLEKIKIEKGRVKILDYDFIHVIKFLEKTDLKSDIIFSDPPYNRGYIKKFLKLLITSDILVKDGFFIFEIHRNEYKENEELLKNFVIIKEKKYGDVYILILRQKEI